jgi:HK97 gp10 family phage protein
MSAAAKADMSRSRFSGRLRGLVPAIVPEISKALFAAGEALAVDAQTSITEGSVSGRQHIPSAAGQPPNADTHHLANNIEVTQDTPLKVVVTSKAKYSASLEFGTSRMSERPFMRPAAERARPEINKRISRAARRAIRQHFRG